MEASRETEYPCTLEKNELPMLSQTAAPVSGAVVSITAFACSSSAVTLPMLPSMCLYSRFKCTLAYGDLCMTTRSVTATTCSAKVLESCSLPAMRALPDALLAHTSPALVSATSVCPFGSPNCSLSRLSDQALEPSTVHSREASVVR